MKVPLTPPSFKQLLQQHPIELCLENGTGPCSAQGSYLHWDKLRHLDSPAPLNNEQWWLSMKLARKSSYEQLLFTSKQGHPFNFAPVPGVLQRLRYLEQLYSGETEKLSSNTIDNLHPAHLTHFMMEEAINSSQIEGAVTTRRAAKQMLQERRAPRSHSEQMIMNNYRAMQFIQDIKNEPLSLGLIFELQKIVTENTLDDPSCSGKLRTEEDNIQIVDNHRGQVLHVPPPVEQLPGRLELLCRYANTETQQRYLSPFMKGIMLHFMLAYDHPFVDGNGRTARALFYWGTAQYDFPLIQYISISQIIARAKVQYARSFLYTETDENDVTYFVEHQCDVLVKAHEVLADYIQEKQQQRVSLEKILSSNPALKIKLNSRQMALLEHALKNPETIYQIEGHRQWHQVRYDTARNDLLKLRELKLLSQEKMGKAFVFIVPKDLKQRLSQV